MTRIRSGRTKLPLRLPVDDDADDETQPVARQSHFEGERRWRVCSNVRA